MTSHSAPEPLSRSQGMSLFLRISALLVALALAGCAAPIGVERIHPREARREFSSSVLSTGEISADAKILLRRTNQTEAWEDDPAKVLAHLHALLQRPINVFTVELRSNVMAYVAELTFAHASETDDRRYFLAARQS